MIDVSAIRKDFKMIKQTMSDHPLVYFDNAATTLKPQSVVDALTQYYNQYSVNVHRGDYPLGFEVTEKMEAVRTQVAQFINAKDSEIVFQSGATQALNQVAYGYGLHHLKEGDVIVSTKVEHASNILPWFDVAQKTKAVIKYLDLDQQGRITNLDVIDEQTKIVAIAHVSNVLGHTYPVEKIIERAHQFGAKVILDSAQAVPHLPIDVKALDVDFMAFSGHKMLGPTGIGVLYGKYDLLQEMQPLTRGGEANARFNSKGEVLLKNAPTRFEAGTPAIGEILGLGAAISYLEKIGMEQIVQYEQMLNEYTLKKLSKLSNVTIHNPDSQSGIIVFNVDGIFSQDVCAYLGRYGFALRAGNHCAKMIDEVIGTQETCRLSLYIYNTTEEIDRFIEVLSEITLEKTIDLYL